ncbi:MAG: hypothetical protein ACLQME_15340 [Alphaproteobacteria bacterium]
MANQDRERGNSEREITPAMIEAAAGAIQDHLDYSDSEVSPGTAAILAEDALRAAFRARNGAPKNEATQTRERDNFPLTVVKCSSLLPLWLLDHGDDGA